MGFPPVVERDAIMLSGLRWVIKADRPKRRISHEGRFETCTYATRGRYGEVRGDGLPHAESFAKLLVRDHIGQNSKGFNPKSPPLDSGSGAGMTVMNRSSSERVTERGSGMKMGPRMREDTEGDGRFANRPCGRESCWARGSPPSPVFTRAGSNLPPSRGKGLVGVEVRGGRQ